MPFNFSLTLIRWYEQNKRDLPWRHTNDPYKIWLSEIILQQTRVDQGLSYYERFVKNFPTVKQLANAPEKKVMKLWQGLGYYSRARNLHHTAKIIVADKKGKFPGTYDEIIQLKGIGAYTAAAIASFSFNEARAVVDGNVYRVLARIFGIDTPIDSTQGKKDFAELASSLINTKKPALHNQAIMEFGALQCVPRKPACENCPFSQQCFAFAGNKQVLLPVKSKTLKVTKRYFEYFIFSHKNSTYIRQRTGNDIWKNLYEFPLIEPATSLSEEKILKSKELKAILNGVDFTLKRVSKIYKHELSHRTIYGRFWELSLHAALHTKLNYTKIGRGQLPKYAWPRLIDKYLSEEYNFNS